MAQKILIVDDQAGIRMLLTEVLSHEGYETFEAGNGQDALRIQSEHHIDIVLLDMKIPGMDGIEILKQMKKHDPAICVVMMTAYSEQGIVNEALQHGARDIFSKPFDIEDVRKMVRTHITM
ncbi:response regulator [Shouchella lonarensis]|uniref:Two-component system, response regulator, stage 0 sporulation protein F n=1 Tax=Shouchella lonarensis TaxID=1464122 RepID=A0A1G6GWA6_9BACI|nr:response regulator [Shouchella lonarensis]SDB86254.1 two-component system, response regulator, stage 0 sporulation protein F [Shouchella lonarensis]